MLRVTVSSRSFGGKAVESAGQLPALVAATKPGSAVDLMVWRDRARRELHLKVAATTDGEVVAASRGAVTGGRLGMTVRPLPPAERGANDGEDGLVVVDVSGAAAQGHVALLVQRGEARIFVPVELG